MMHLSPPNSSVSAACQRASQQNGKLNSSKEPHSPDKPLEKLANTKHSLNLLDLPDDALRSILRHLPVTKVADISATCTQLKARATPPPSLPSIKEDFRAILEHLETKRDLLRKLREANEEDIFSEAIGILLHDNISETMLADYFKTYETLDVHCPFFSPQHLLSEVILKLQQTQDEGQLLPLFKTFNERQKERYHDQIFEGLGCYDHLFELFSCLPETLQESKFDLFFNVIKGESKYCLQFFSKLPKTLQESKFDLFFNGAKDNGDDLLQFYCTLRDNDLPITFKESKFDLFFKQMVKYPSKLVEFYTELPDDQKTPHFNDFFQALENQPLYLLNLYQNAPDHQKPTHFNQFFKALENDPLNLLALYQLIPDHQKPTHFNQFFKALENDPLYLLNLYQNAPDHQKPTHFNQFFKALKDNPTDLLGLYRLTPKHQKPAHFNQFFKVLENNRELLTQLRDSDTRHKKQINRRLRFLKCQSGLRTLKKKIISVSQLGALCMHLPLRGCRSTSAKYKIMAVPEQELPDHALGSLDERPLAPDY